MDNNFLIPHTPGLKDIVHSFWQVNRCNTDFRKETIIPKGIVEIIFSFIETDDFYVQLGTQRYRFPRCSINGYNTGPIYLQLPDKQIFFGVVFHPTAIKNIFGIPAGEFADQGVDMTLVDPSFNTLWHRLAEQKTFNERVSFFGDWLKKRLPYVTLRERAFNTFLNSNTDKILTVSELSESLCYSPRHLSRKLLELTGMNTEKTLLYKKYQRAVSLIHHSKLSLTEIGYSCDFADQSHFIKTFRSFALITPKEYKNRRSPIAGHIYENVR
jgi:AraC-like DNA-binding protein